jgi:hypothetical protein
MITLFSLNSFLFFIFAKRESGRFAWAITLPVPLILATNPGPYFLERMVRFIGFLIYFYHTIEITPCQPLKSLKTAELARISTLIN